MSTATVSPAPTPINWSPSPELLALTGMLTRANLASVEDRTFGLRRLLELTTDSAAAPINQVRTCGTVKSLPFLRISKKMRLNLLHAEFVAAGREFNRALLAAKITVGDRLDAIAIDTAAPHEVQRLAAAVSVRASTNMRVEWAELTDREIPDHLLPPPTHELSNVTTPAPVAEMLATTTRTTSAQERAQARATLAAMVGDGPGDELPDECQGGPHDPILDAAIRAGLLEQDFPVTPHGQAGGMFGQQASHGGKRNNGFKERKRVSR